MALRSPALWMGNPAVQHTAQNDRLMLAGLHRPEVGSTAANRPLTATSGVIAGPPGTMGEVTLLSNTQFTVNPARWVLYSSASALGGTYKVVNDAVETLGITAQNASQYRRSYFGVWVIDSFVAGSGDDLPHWGIVDGALAASAGVATLPSAGSLPANFLALGEFLIPPVGQAVTYTPYDVRTGLRGGILPVTATDTRNGAYVGQYRDHPTYGQQRWDGTVWNGAVALGMARAQGRQTTAQGGLAAGQFVTITFQVVDFDVPGGSFSGGTGVFTCQPGQAGTYLVSGNVVTTNNGASFQTVNVRLIKNGTAVPGLTGAYGGGLIAATTGPHLVQLAVGDTIALQGSSNGTWATGTYPDHASSLTVVRVA